MRKLYALLLTVVMVVGLSLTAFGSASPQGVAKSSVNAVSVSGVAGLSVSQATTNVVLEAQGLAGNPERLASLGIAAGAHVAAVVDISFSGEIPAGGAKIPVTVNNANVGDYVYIVHRNSVTGTWEVVGQGVLGADMTIVGTFLNFSPVMIMVVPAADFAAAGVRAPRTGEF